jgi:hypothetical protein
MAQPRLIRSRYAGKCRNCRQPYAYGDYVYWQKGSRGAIHEHCYASDSTSEPNPTTVGSEVSASSTTAGNTRIFRIEWAELKSAMLAGISGILPKTRRKQNAQMFHGYLTQDSGRFGGFSADDIKRWLEHGYQLDGLEFDNPPIPIREKRRFIFTEEGDEFHFDRALSGDDSVFSEWTKREVIPGLAIEAEISFSGGTSHTVLTGYFQFLCRAAYALEKSGVDLQVTIKNTVDRLYSGAGITSTHVIVKKENEATDFHAWSAMLSPATLRAYMFACKTLHADSAGEICYSSMGSPAGSQWAVKWNPERAVLEITPSPVASHFPLEEMETQLRAALVAMHNPE